MIDLIQRLEAANRRMSDLEVQLAMAEQDDHLLVNGIWYRDGVVSLDDDGKLHVSKCCIVCRERDGKHTELCIVGKYEALTKPVDDVRQFLDAAIALGDAARRITHPHEPPRHPPTDDLEVPFP